MLATYREGPYIIEEGFAMVDQDGEMAHQYTFADTPGQANRLLLEFLGFDRYEAERDLWRVDAAVRITDTNLARRDRVRNQTVLSWQLWDRYRTSYIF